MRKFIGVLGRSAGLLFVVGALAACGAEEGQGDAAVRGAGLSDRDLYSGGGGEGGDRCEAILGFLDGATEEQAEDILAAWNECIEDTAEEGEGEVIISDPGCEEPPPGPEVCEEILFELNFVQTQEEADWVVARYNDCLAGFGFPPPDQGGDVCAPILDRLNFAQTQEEVDWIFVEYDACVQGQGGGFEDPALACEPILEGLNYVQTEEEANFIIEEYNRCIEGIYPQDPVAQACDPLLERLNYAQSDEEINAIFAEYDACVQGFYPPDPAAQACEPILAEAQFAQTEEEVNAIYERYNACYASFYPVDPAEEACGPLREQANLAQTQEEAQVWIEEYNRCLENFYGPPHPSVSCEEAEAGILSSQSPEEAVVFLDAYAQCIAWDGPTVLECSERLSQVVVETPEQEQELLSAWGECLREGAARNGEPCVALLADAVVAQTPEEAAWAVREFAVCDSQGR